MHMRVRTVLSVVIGIGTLASWPQRTVMGQDIALAEGKPRFLYRASSAVTPVEVDVNRTPILRRAITLTIDHPTVGRLLTAIEEQTGLTFVYGTELATDRPVLLRADSISVAGALTVLLLDSGFDVVLSPGRAVALVRAKGAAPGGPKGTIVGKVSVAKSGERLAGAEVVLEHTRRRTTTDTSGRYRLADVDSGRYTLTVRRFGYRKESLKVLVRGQGEDTVDLALEPTAVTLNELVTTATGRQRRRDLGNAITTIKADSVLRNAPVRNLTDLLQDRVPGLAMQHTSGAPGDPARLRLRGLGSLQRSNDPVVIVDGVRVYAAQSAARNGNLTNGIFDGRQSSNPAPSPLDQIDPNIVETVEVFKGPSAATLYGADAANGVIVITTKKGRPGPTRWHASAERGITNPLGRYPVGYYQWGSQISTDVFVGSSLTLCAINNRGCVRDSLTQFQALNDPRFTVLGKGQRTGVSLTASGGTQALAYSITGTYGDETGLLKLPGLELERFRTAFHREAPDWMRQPHRLKEWRVASRVDARLSPAADVTLTASLGRTQQQRSDLENQVAGLSATYIDPINGRYYRATSSASVIGAFDMLPSSAILQNYYTRTTAAALTFTTGLNGTWRPRSWLDVSGQAGLNVIPRNDQRLRPAGLVSQNDSGAVSRGTGQSLVSTFTLQGNLHRPVGSGFAFVTNVGLDLTTQSTVDLVTHAAGLVPGTGTIGGAKQIWATDASASTSVFGWHIEPRLQGQRLSLSTGLRLDGGSAYGTRVTGIGGGGLLALPKLNGSWVISEEPFFPFKSLFTSLQLRGAYGQAQVQPGPADRLRTYHYLTTGMPSSVELSTLGNTQLRPERSTEFEGGFTADLLDSRVSAEFTAYRKTQVDALMPVTLPPSVNGGTTVLTNIGTIRNTGVELTLRFAPVQSGALGWSSELSYSHNHNELVKLGDGVVPNRETGIVAGYPVGSRWARPILGYADQDHDGVLQNTEILIGDSSVYVGRLYPAYQMVLHSTLTLFHGIVGITGGLSYDAGMTQVDELGGQNWVLTRALTDPSTPLNQQAAVLSYFQTTYGLTRDISTLRFNELSINCQAPSRVARFLRVQRLSLALQGRNLALHSTYQGRDPDVNAWGPGEGIVDGGQLAQPRTWQVRVDVDY